MGGRERHGWLVTSLRWLPALMAFVSIGASAFAQEGPRQPLEIEVDQGRWALRTGAPVPLRLKVTCSSPGILEGDLELEITNAYGDRIAEVQLPDQFYSPGRQEVEYLLPIQSHTIAQTIAIKSRFRDRSGNVSVNNGLLIPPPRRSFVAAIVQSGEQNESIDDFAWLSLEAHCPKLSGESEFSPMLTLTPRFSASDLPRDPLKHLAHDIVVVEAGGFRLLSGAQILALEAWVRGGGSLFLQVGAGELSSEQQGFIDRLVASHPGLLSDDIEGTKLIPIIAGAVFGRIETGFGRVLLTTQRSWSAASERDRLEAFGFLWRLRQEHLDSLRSTGLLSLEQLQGEYLNALQEYQYQISQSQRMGGRPNVMSRQSGGTVVSNTLAENDELLRHWEHILSISDSNRPNEIVEALMPEDVQLVPVWLLGTIILTYIAAIGFGDYIVLGRLKRRRWTWFTFPAMTLAVTLLSIGTAKGYLGSSQEVNVVEYRDVAEDGRISRIDRFEMHFRSSPGQLVTPLDQMVFTPVSHHSNINGTAQRNQPDDAQPIAIRGVPTLKAQAFQQLAQWKPQLNRIVSFPRDRMCPLIPKPPASGSSWSSAEYKAALVSQIQQAFPGVIWYEMFVIRGGKLTGVDNIFASQVTQFTNKDAKRSYILAVNCLRPNPQTTRRPSGVFSLFDQISPSADTGLMDMVVAGPGHAVLCVSVREPTGELVIYRWKIKAPTEQVTPPQGNP